MHSAIGVCVLVVLVIAIIAGASVAIAALAQPTSSSDDAALTRALLGWSNVTMEASAADHALAEPRHGGPLRTARAYAIVHAAMADVVALGTGEFAPLIATAPGAIRRDALHVAVDAAASHALNALYPGAVASVPAASSEAARFGLAVAIQVLAERARDGANHSEPPVDAFESVAPGRWRRDPVARHPIALGGEWARRVAPWTLAAHDQFRAPPPPTLESDTYAMEYAEALSLGGDASTACVRDEWRTFVGRFWAYDGTANICAPARLYMRLVHTALAHARPARSGVEVARLLGLVGVALADAGLAAWDSKYHYSRERPVTAVRESAAHDHNALTAIVPGWTPLGAPATNADGAESPNFTPPFPAYPSGHAVFGAAIAHVLRLSALEVTGMSFVSDEFDGVARDSSGAVRPRVVRVFSSLDEIEEENGQSRMYLGIHWASDKSAGNTMGRAVAEHVLATAYARR